MNLQPFFKSYLRWFDIPKHVRAEMLREAGNVEDIALAILKANRERKDKPTIMDGLGAQLHILIRELSLLRNQYDTKLVELRAKGDDGKFAQAWRDLYSHIINEILEIEPHVRTEVQNYERFILAQRALAQRRT